MAEWTGRSRVMATLKREYPDRVPISVHYPKAHELLGFTRQECLVDPDKALQAMIKVRGIYPSDMVGVPGDPLLPTVAEATYEATFGQTRERKRLLADKSVLAGLELRDPRRNRRYSAYLDMCRKVDSVFKDAAVAALVPGPWSGAVEMRGAEALIYDTMDDPGFVHDLMRFCTGYSKARALAIAETGVMVRIADPSSGCSLISPQVYRGFVKPYHHELVNSLKTRGALIVLHICGYTDPIMADLVSLGVDVIELDGPSSLKRMVETAGKAVTIKGNLKAELFGEGTPEEMEAAVKECMEIAARRSGYIISPGCSIPDHTPLGNIQAYWQAALKYGKYARPVLD